MYVYSINECNAHYYTHSISLTLDCSVFLMIMLLSMNGFGSANTQTHLSDIHVNTCIQNAILNQHHLSQSSSYVHTLDKDPPSVHQHATYQTWRQWREGLGRGRRWSGWGQREAGCQPGPPSKQDIAILAVKLFWVYLNGVDSGLDGCVVL